MGSTVAARVLALGDPNHSHVCGINQSTEGATLASIESFPRMWDQPADVLDAVLLLRIIPTYVGSTR